MDEYSWEIIEGGADNGESPIIAAERELQEEAGLKATQIFDLGGQIHLSNSHSSERGYLFLAKGLTECDKQPEETEILQLKRLPILECLDLIETNQIYDSLSIIGIYRAARLLKLL